MEESRWPSWVEERLPLRPHRRLQLRPQGTEKAGRNREHGQHERGQIEPPKEGQAEEHDEGEHAV